jgi:hypothetical protein
MASRLKLRGDMQVEAMITRTMKSRLHVAHPELLAIVHKAWADLRRADSIDDGACRILIGAKH